MKAQCKLYLISTPGFFLLLFLAGCLSRSGLPLDLAFSSETPSAAIISNSSQPMITPTRIMSTSNTTPSQTSIPSPSPALSSPTWTPLPKLPPKDAQQLVTDLLQNNAGCKLPCWWGITPGETTWQEANNFLSSFAVEEAYIISSTNNSSFVSWFYFYASEDKSRKVIQGYTISNGIVESIEVRFSKVQSFKLFAWLNDYGQPGEVWMRTFGTEYKGTIPFYLILFYPDKGIVALFESNDAKLNGDKVMKCFDQDTLDQLALWQPEKIYTFQEARQLTEGMKFNDNFPLLPLEKATDLDIESFYLKFKDIDVPECLETPAELWPGQFQ